MSISSVYFTTPYYTPLGLGLKAPPNPDKAAPTQSTPDGEVPYYITPNGTYQKTEAYKAAEALPTTKADAAGKKVTDPGLVAIRNAALLKAQQDAAADPKVIKSYYKGSKVNYGIDTTDSASNSASNSNANASRASTTTNSSDPLGNGATPNPLISNANMIAKAGDNVSLGGIIQPDGKNATRFSQFQIALRDSNTGGVANGTLRFNGQPAIDSRGVAVTGVTYVGGIYTIEAENLASLSYQVGANGTKDDLVVVGVSKPGTNGIGIQYSTPLAVQVRSGAYRSLNAAAAVSKGAGGSDPTLELAQATSIWGPRVGIDRPILKATPNLTVNGGDSLQLSEFAVASLPDNNKNGSIKSYNIALGGSDGNAHGTLYLNGVAVAGTGFTSNATTPLPLTNFTADQFAALTYMADSEKSNSVGHMAATGFITLSAVSSGISTQGVNLTIYSDPAQIAVTAAGVVSASAFPGLIGSAALINGANNLTQLAANARSNQAAGLSVNLGYVAAGYKPPGQIIALATAFNTTASTNGGTAVTAYNIALSGDVSSPNAGYLSLDGGATNLINNPQYYNRFTGIYTIGAADWSKVKFIAGQEGSTTNVTASAINGVAGGTTPIYSQTASFQVAVAGTANAPVSDPVAANGYLHMAQSAQLWRPNVNAPYAPSLATSGNTSSAAGDVMSLADLVQATPGKDGRSVTKYQIALSDAQGGTASGYLSLGYSTGVPGNLQSNAAVYNSTTGVYSITADQLTHLRYVAGKDGTADTISISAIADSTDVSGGAARNIVYSSVAQFTNQVTGIRSLNTAGGISGQVDYTNHKVIAITDNATNVAGGSAIYSPIGRATRPILTTTGNISIAAGDKVSLGNLLSVQDGKAADGSDLPVTDYEIALRNADTGIGATTGHLYLMKNGRLVDVSNQIYFSATDLPNLIYQAAANASPGTDQMVVTAVGKKIGVAGTATSTVDSQAVAFNIAVAPNGQRSLNAANAVQASSNDPIFDLAQSAQIFRGFGKNTPPSLTSTTGNFTLGGNQAVTLSDLFQAAPGITSAANAITSYKVAIGGTVSQGTLYLNGVAVAGAGLGAGKLARTSFTPDEFAQLSYQSGAVGSNDSLIVAAVATDANTNYQVWSPAIEINANVNGVISPNIGQFILGNGKPNFTIAGNQTIGVKNIFSEAAWTKATLPSNANYTVTLSGANKNGTLYLNGVAVAGVGFVATAANPAAKTSFTTTEYGQLRYVSGAVGSSDDLSVAVSTPLGVQYPAYTVTANVTGQNSSVVQQVLVGNPRAGANIATPIDGYGQLMQTARIYSNNFSGKPLKLLTNLQGDFADAGPVTLSFLVNPVARGSKNILVPGGNVTVGDRVNIYPNPNPVDTMNVVTNVNPLQVVTINSNLTPTQVARLKAGSSVQLNTVGSGLVAVSLNSVANGNQIFINPSAAVKSGDVIYDSNGNRIGTVTNVQTAQAVTVSNPFINGVRPNDKMMFTKTSLESETGNAIGQFSSTAPIDTNSFKTFNQTTVVGQNGYGQVSKFAPPGTQSTRTALYLLNSTGLGGYQTSDPRAANNRNLSVI